MFTYAMKVAAIGSASYYERLSQQFIRVCSYPMTCLPGRLDLLDLADVGLPREGLMYTYC